MGRLCLGMIASNADIFHSSGVKRGPTVERCEFTVAMDDYLNVHSRAQLLVSRIGGGAEPGKTLPLPCVFRCLCG